MSTFPSHAYASEYLGVQFNSFLKHLTRVLIRLFPWVSELEELDPAQEVVVGFEVIRSFGNRNSVLRHCELKIQGRHDLSHDLVLQRKDVPQRAVVMFSPYMIARGRIHQLSRDAHLVVSFAYTALQHVLHS